MARYPRLPANDRVLIQGLSDPAWVVNWSAKGFCALSDGVLEEGQRLQVRFPERFAKGEATVVWSQCFPDGCLAGFQLVSLHRRALSLEA